MKQLKLSNSKVNQSVIAESHKYGMLLGEKKTVARLLLGPLLYFMSKKQRAISGLITHPIKYTD